MAKTKTLKRKLDSAKFGARGMTKNGYRMLVTVGVFDETDALALLVGAQLKIVVANAESEEGQETMAHGADSLRNLEATVDVRKIAFTSDDLSFTMEFSRDTDGALLDTFAFRTNTLRLERVGDASKTDGGKEDGEAA